MLTVKELKKVLENVPDDVEVRYQRIEDVYFETHGWDKCANKMIFDCHGQYHFQFNEDGSVIKDEEGNPIKKVEHNDECYSEYVEVYSAYKHLGDNIFVLNAHY